MSGLQPHIEIEGETAISLSLADQIRAGANRIEYETDALGRRLGVRKLNALDMFNISLMLGQHANIAAVLDQAMAASSVVEIDTEKLMLPATILELKARIGRLDFHGYAAAAKALERLTPKTDNGGEKEAVKN